MKRIAVCLILFLTAGTLFAAREENFSEEKSTHFIIYYRDIPKDFVESVVTYAERYYDELTEKLGFTRLNYWTWENRAKIYIYPDRETFERETKQPGWAGGAAAYDRKTIWTFPHEAGFFDSLLPHEIGHIVFREVVGSRKSIPLWLEEGVASYLEQGKRIGSEKMVLEAMGNETFIPFEELSRIDPYTLRMRSDVNLLYAESVSIVNYLIQKYGVESFNNFCEKLKDGKTLDDALSYAYFYIRSAQDLKKFWEEYLQGKSKSKSAMML